MQAYNLPLIITYPKLKPLMIPLEPTVNFNGLPLIRELSKILPVVPVFVSYSFPVP